MTEANEEQKPVEPAVAQPSDRHRTGERPLTVRNVVQAFRALVVDARGYGWTDIPSNPFTDPFLRKVMPAAMPVAGKDVIVALRPEQLRVLAHAPGPRRVLNLVALATGLRESELAGLAWRDDVEAKRPRSCTRSRARRRDDMASSRQLGAGTRSAKAWPYTECRAPSGDPAPTGVEE